MTDKTDDGGPAFPNDRIEPSNGMSLRDYFAAQVLASIADRTMVSFTATSDATLPARAAQFAYAVADVMIEARKR